MTLYSFTDHPEHEAQLAAHAQTWIDNALSCEPANQPAMIDAINGLYEAADLPRPLTISFVRSPLAMAVAGGVAAGVWWLRENPGQHRKLFGRRLSEDELMGAIAPTCAFAVAAGMGQEVSLPPATRSATYSATRSATASATASATDSATASATDIVRFLVLCTGDWWKMQDGGSDWSAWPCFLSFFDRVAGLDLPIYGKWRHYEQAALNGGQRVMHAKFCIVSDRHTCIHVDQQRELHCEDGPAKTYGDGWALNYWHGLLVPADFFDWDVERVLAEKNSEVRRAGIERLGWDTITDRLHLVSSADDPGNPGQTLTLYDLPRDLRDLYGQPARILVCANASLDKGGHRRRFGLPVPVAHRDPITAAADLFGVTPDQYRAIARAS